MARPRGFAHIGVLQALDEAKVPIGIVAGTSAGSLVGAFYAAGFSPWKMQEVALKVRDIDVADLSSGNKRGMIGGAALKRLVNGYLDNMPIEKMQRRYAAVATDLATGEKVAIQRGDVGSAVVASCSIPGVFIPTMFEGRELVDGGLTSPVPVAVARQMGADVVIGVNGRQAQHCRAAAFMKSSCSRSRSWAVRWRSWRARAPIC